MKRKVSRKFDGKKGERSYYALVLGSQFDVEKGVLYTERTIWVDALTYDAVEEGAEILVQ